MPNALSKIDVFILCGGLGTRLRSISKGFPKSMVRINDRPFLDIIINYLAGFGFKRFILGVGYKADKIAGYYKNNKILGLNILFSKEDSPLGTGGAVKKARRLFKSSTVLIVNGDSFCKFDPLKFLSLHKQRKAAISILLRKVPEIKDYGSIKIDKNCRILGFCEKTNFLKRAWINAVIYAFEKKIFNKMPKKMRFSLETDFFPKILEEKCFGFVYNDVFIDIGTPERYSRALDIFDRSSCLWKKLK